MLTFENEFDIQRAFMFDRIDNPPLTVRETYLLAEWVNEHRLPPDLPMLMAVHQEVALAFITLHLNYHQVAQGEVDGVPYLAAFCTVCNSGMLFSPMIEGKLHHFHTGGVYNAMSMLVDKESGSIWDHISGECVYGALKGERLKLLTDIRHLSAAQVLERHPDARLIFSSLDAPQQEAAEQLNNFRLTKEGPIPPFIERTMGAEDTRMPRLDMGLGVWTPGTRRYYPFTAVNERNNVVFDTIDGRRVLIYIDPEYGFPEAFYTDATSAEWRGDRLMLNNGVNLRRGVLHDAAGRRIPMEPPRQLFVRWYGFAFKFPNCEIYTDAA